VLVAVFLYSRDVHNGNGVQAVRKKLFFPVNLFDLLPHRLRLLHCRFIVRTSRYCCLLLVFIIICDGLLMIVYVFMSSNEVLLLTQQLLGDDPRVAYCSLHEEGGYPRTGLVTETGASNNVLNVPLPSGCQWPQYEVRCGVI